MRIHVAVAAVALTIAAFAESRGPVVIRRPLTGPTRRDRLAQIWDPADANP